MSQCVSSEAFDVFLGIYDREPGERGVMGLSRVLGLCAAPSPVEPGELTPPVCTVTEAEEDRREM